MAQMSMHLDFTFFQACATFLNLLCPSHLFHMREPSNCLTSLFLSCFSIIFSKISVWWTIFHFWKLTVGQLAKAYILSQLMERIRFLNVTELWSQLLFWYLFICLPPFLSDNPKAPLVLLSVLRCLGYNCPSCLKIHRVILWNFLIK